MKWAAGAMDHAVWQERLAEIERQIVEAEKRPSHVSARSSQSLNAMASGNGGARFVSGLRGIGLSMHLSDRQWLRGELGAPQDRYDTSRTADQ
jgi:hypothetical protein